MPAIVSTTSPVGTPPSQIGPSAVALPFSSSTLYVPDPSRRTPPVSSAVVMVYTTRTLNDCWKKMPRPLSYVNSLQPFPFTRVHDCPIVRSWLSTIARPLPIAFSLLRMRVMWSEAVTWTPFEPNLLMLSPSRRMALEPSIRIPTDPPASPEFALTREIVVTARTFTIQMSVAPLGGAVVQFDCTQSMLKNFVIFSFELSTFRPYPGFRSFSCRFAKRYGSAAVPEPDTTPFAGVKSLSRWIRIGP